MKDEPTYSDFQAQNDVLDQYLVEIPLENGRTFCTYKKLRTIEATAIGYFTELNNTIDGFQIRENDVVIDVGAHHGIITIYTAAMGALVEAYEPNPLNYSILQRNIVLNKDLKITSYNCAVADKEGDLLFNFGKTSTTGAMVAADRDWKRTDQNASVKTIDINIILSKHNKVKLLKMDCEGSEYDIFQSMADENFSKVETLYIEVHPTKNHEIRDFEDILKEKNFPYVKKEVAHGCYEFICSKLIS